MRRTALCAVLVLVAGVVGACSGTEDREGAVGGDSGSEGGAAPDAKGDAGAAANGDTATPPGDAAVSDIADSAGGGPGDSGGAPGDAGGSPGDAGIDSAGGIDAAAARAVLEAQGKVICERGFECAPALTISGYGGTLEGCIEREAPSLAPVATQPGVTVTPAQIQACADSLANGSCSVFRRSVFGNAPTPECDLRGTLAADSPCVHSAQCESGICIRQAGALCGTCRGPIPTGEACKSWVECGPGAGCASGKCAPLVEVGGACNTDAPCHDDLACLEGTCAVALAEGAPCTSLIGQCDKFAGLACDPNASVCTALSFAEKGAACGVTGNGLFLCTDGDCVPNLLFGTCAEKAPDGGACDMEKGPTCQFHSMCYEAVCTPLFEAVCE